MLRYQKGYICNGYTFVVNKSDVHNATDDMFVEATALLPDTWISVNERLPLCGARVIVTDGAFVGEAFRMDENRWERPQGYPWYELFGRAVTHWMPLPIPLKEAT